MQFFGKDFVEFQAEVGEKKRKKETFFPSFLPLFSFSLLVPPPPPPPKRVSQTILERIEGEKGNRTKINPPKKESFCVKLYRSRLPSLLDEKKVNEAGEI